MPSKKLVNYIREQLSRGYNTAAIKSYLLKYGYSSSDVDDAMRAVYSHEVRHVIHFSPTTLIGIAVIFIAAIAASFVFLNFNSGKNPETLLDMNLESVKTTSNPGNELVFISELDNLGSSKRYDVSLKYELIDSSTNNIVTFKEETRAIETKGSKQISMQVPQDAASGDYILRAIATYDGQRAVATLPVKIEAEEPIAAPVDETDTETEDETEETLDTTDETQIEDTMGKTEDDPSQTQADSALNTFETIEKVGQIAGSDSKEAEKLCSQLELQTSRDLCFNKMAEVLGDQSHCMKIADERTKDVCLSNVAKIASRSEVCQGISKDSRKDSCYMNFVIDKKDYSVCAKIANQYLRQSCESLRQLSELNVTEVSFYESLINQSVIWV